MRIAAAALALAGLSTAAHTPAVLVTRDAYLMGTHAHLATYASERAEGLAVLDRALAILEETEAELSTWKDTSALSALNRQEIDVPLVVAPGLCSALGHVFTWQAETGGTFDPAIGALASAWQIHGTGRIPSEAQLQAARRRSGIHHLGLNRARCEVTRRADVTLDPGAFGKGDALDRVETELGGAPWMIDLGGQVSVGSAHPEGQGWTIDIAHPKARDRAVLSVTLREGSLSTSAGSERDIVVEGRRVAHHLDPRTGQPASFDGSVTVWHRRGIVADMLSTALYVMGPEDGMAWANARGIAACFLVPRGRRLEIRTSRAFEPLLAE